MTYDEDKEMDLYIYQWSSLTRQVRNAASYKILHAGDLPSTHQLDVLTRSWHVTSTFIAEARRG